jgi:poly(3-hydroxybutyrate) depolymerase
MAAVMLATWPDVFAAGAIASGIPYRCATTVNGAYACQSMGSHPELHRTATAWGDLVRAADPGFAGPWPRVAIFHGAADATVSSDNQIELIKQWTDVHGGDQTADDTAMIGAHTRERYKAGDAVVVESYKIAGMGHAVAMGDDPLMPCAPMGGSYIEDRDLCTAARAVDFFGIADLGDDGDPVDPDPPPGDDAPMPGDDMAPVDPLPCGCHVRGGGDGVAGGLLALGVLIAITRRRRA